MKIVETIKSIPIAQSSLEGSSPKESPAKSGDFRDLLGKALEAIGGREWESLRTEMRGMETRLKNRTAVAPRDLLYLQMRLGDVHLKVELASKLAESLLATARKFQSQQ